MRPLENALTIDVEDYFQVAAFFPYISYEDWKSYPSRVEINTQRLLALFAERDIRATFFVLGWIAEAYPDLIRCIAAAGHEIASHGFSHQLIYRQDRDTFRQETLRAKGYLEDLLGEPIAGYRASTYSITPRSAWALDILAEAGFLYDSSLFPVRHPQYGFPDAPRFPYRLNTATGPLVEFPPSTVRLLGQNLPVAGGGYFRQFPYLYTRTGLRRINEHEGQPFIFYLHPWEIDPDQPRIAGISRLTRIRHYANLHKTEGRLRQLFKDFAFTTVRQVLVTQGLLPAAQPVSVLQAA